MADGVVTIDIDMPLDKLKNDMQLADDLLQNLGKNAGNEMDDNFKKVSSDLVNEAQKAKKDIDEELKKPTAPIKPKIDDNDVQQGTQKIITSLRKLPKEQKVKLDADAKKAGIDDFTALLKRVPKKTRTEILAQAQKGEVIDYEALLTKLPRRILTSIKLNDDASDKLKSIQESAENTGASLSKLKEIIAGSFIGGIAVNGVTAVVSSLKDIATEGASASDAMDKFRSTMQLGGFGEEKIKKTSDEVMEYANKTVYDLDDISNTTAQLAANGIKNYMGLTEAAGNLNAQAGGNAETFKSVAMMLTQTAGAGKLTTENWNQLADAIPGASGVLQKAMKDAGAYTGNFRDAMADGQITADEFADAITKLGQTDGAKKAAESTTTFEGAFGNLQATVVDGMKNVIDAFGKDKFTGPINNVGSFIQGFFGRITKAITDNKRIIDTLGSAFSSVFSAIGNTLSMFSASFKVNVSGILGDKSLTQNVTNLKKGFDNIMESIKPVEQAISGLLGVITGGIFAVAVDLVKGLAKGLGLVGDEANKTKGKMDFSGIARIFSTVSQTLNVVLGFIKPVVSLLGEMAGVIAKSAFSTFADVLNRVGKALGAAFDKLSPLIPALKDTDKGASAVTKHETALKAVGVAIASIGTAMATIKGAKSIFNAASAGISALSKVTKIATGVQAAFNAVMAINPVVLIIGAVIALGVAVYEAYKHFKPFRDWVNKTWDSLKSFGSGVAKVGKQIYHGIVDGISDVVSWIKKNWKGLGLLLVNPIAGAIKLLYDNNKGFKKWADSVIDTIKNAWKSATKALVKVWESIVDGIVKVWKPLSKALSVTWDALKKVAEITFKAIGAVILAPIVLVSATIVAIWKAVHKPLEAAWKAISKTASSVWNSIKKTTEKVWNGIKDTVIDVSLAIYKPVKKAWDKVVQVVTDLWNGLKKTASKIWNGIKDAVVDATEAVYKPVQKAFTTLGNWIGDKWDSIKKTTSTKWKGIKDTISKMSEKAKSLGTKYAESLKQSVGEKWDAVKSVTSKAWEKVATYVGDSSNDALRRAGRNFNALKSTMSDILDSISRTWRRAWSGIADYFGSIWNGIQKNARNGLNGVIGFLNGGIGGINNVVHFFGGKKQTISPIPKLAKGGRITTSNKVALVNDEESSIYREAIFRKDGTVELPKERNVLTHLEVGDAVMPAKQTAMLLGLPQYKSGFGGWLGKAANWIGNVSGDIGEWVADKIDKLEDALKDPLGVLKRLFDNSKNDAKAIWHTIGEGAGRYLPESAVNWFKNTLAGFKKKFDESGGNPPGAGTKRWKPYVKKALAANGLPTSESYVQAWLRQIQSESGGNPKAVQGGYVDINTLTGDLAKGLLQTISRTFNAYAFPGHRNIFNGYDNMLAAIHYAKARYGSRMLSVIGHGHGYANGGHIYSKQLAWLAEDGDEFVINNRKPNADMLLASAIKQRAEINPNSFSAKIAHIIDSAKFSGTNGYGMAPSSTQVNPTHLQNIDGILKVQDVPDKDVVIKVKLDGKTIANASYPWTKVLQSREITLINNGGAIPSVF
ncbi:tape measure protein [Ligilactobacillus agilis]|uniref:tape measure protein n=1 Tax=Ligilactobacillus agilis TaxID=1601 RepID=UPI00255C4578|nr:tape measure protein [Ligilactobacillus agilis]